jgi:hypothetical protein
MSEQQSPRTRPASDELHPAVYLGLIGAAAWFAIAIWGFAGDGYADWLLVVVSGFVLIACAIPAILSRVGRDRASHCQKLRDWASGDFVTWTDRGRSRNAAIEILLPLGAAAVGMTAFAIVFAVVEHAA